MTVIEKNPSQVDLVVRAKLCLKFNKRPLQRLGLLGPRPSEPRKKEKPLRSVPMRDEFFVKIGWTRSFISGPTDSLHNPYMVWCHICKKNFSVRSKGSAEILRHHKTQKHLCKGQRWRYEYLRKSTQLPREFSTASELGMARFSPLWSLLKSCLGLSVASWST